MGRAMKVTAREEPDEEEHESRIDRKVENRVADQIASNFQNSRSGSTQHGLIGVAEVDAKSALCSSYLRHSLP